MSDSFTHQNQFDKRIEIHNVSFDNHLSQIDRLLQAKVLLLQARINRLQVEATGNVQILDSIADPNGTSFLYEKLDNQTHEQYSGLLHDFNQTLETYKSQMTDSPEITWIDHYNDQLNQLERVVIPLQDKILTLEDLQVLKSYSQQLQQIFQESSGYFKEIQDIVNGGLSDESPLMQKLESKIGHYPEFQELQKVTAEFERVKKMPKGQQDKLKSHQDPYKIKSQAKELVNKHFSRHQDKLQAAQQKLATFKKKYSSVQTTKDMSTAVKRNSLEGEPLSERLVLGGTFQINPSFSQANGRTTSTGASSTSTSKVPTSVDISPLLGYRLNKKLTMGIGATYRAVIEIDEFEAKDQVYGYRGFVQQGTIKGFYIHGEYENLSTASTTFNTSDEVNRNWQPGALAGIGKEFTLFKQVKGQVMVLYNFLYEEGSSLYRKPWMVRFGFVR